MKSFNGLHRLAQSIQQQGGLWHLSGSVSGPAHILPWMLGASAPCLVLLATDKEAQKYQAALSNHVSEETPVYYLPHVDFWTLSENRSFRLDQRQQAIGCLCSGSRGVVVTTLLALAQKSLPFEQFRSNSRTIFLGAERTLDEMIGLLDQLGYRQSSLTRERGTYSVRGSIVDLHSSFYRQPIRLEFFGDHLESIRYFNADTQTSTEEVEKFDLYPASDFGIVPESGVSFQRLHEYLISYGVPGVEVGYWLQLLEDNPNSFALPVAAPLLVELEPVWGQLPHNHWLIVHGVPNEIMSNAQDLLGQMIANAEAALEAKNCTVAAQEHFQLPDRLEGVLSRAVLLDPMAQVSNASNVLIPGGSSLSSQHASGFHRWLKAWLVADGRVVVCVDEVWQLQLVEDLLRSMGIDVVRLDSVSQAWGSQTGVSVIVGRRFERWEDPAAKLVFLKVQDLPLQLKKPGSKKIRPNSFGAPSEISRSDIVVHEKYGVGRYVGSRFLKIAGSESEFLHVEYRGGDSVYVPISDIHLLSKYTVDATGSVKLDRLGTDAWQRKHRAAKESAEIVAERLLKLHAKRKMTACETVPIDLNEFERFVASFPYPETDDQLAAFADIERDLNSGHLMDRMLIGDVGFGKTEVMLRACMYVLLMGKQVVVVLPTTILCYQTLRVFRQRFSGYPVQVEAVSRLNRQGDNRDAKTRFIEKKIDILVGTHGVLDLAGCQQLGLVVIDEEHKFGVAHKEKLKSISEGAHLLTLSATPLPRSLNMGYLGLRDISLLSHPPPGRKPVRTVLKPFDSKVMVDAIQGELSRGGQVFLLFNDVSRIDAFTKSLGDQLPKVRFGIVHGQLVKSAIEGVMAKFIQQDFDVLVCSTIIESGVDLPNVNTLIVVRAENLGLAQLHQLRGRVGRSNRQAYCYLLVERPDFISDDARRRLESIVANQGLGSGMQIASADMDIRGVGNLLGMEQSGHLESVGFELYSRMLKEQIEHSRNAGGSSPGDVEPEIKLKVSAYLPEAYVPSESERLGLYRQLASFDDVPSAGRLRHVLQDRFGEIPSQVDNLFRVSVIRILCRSLRVASLTVHDRVLVLSFEQPESFVANLGSELRDQGVVVGSGSLFVDLQTAAAGPSREMSIETLAEIEGVLVACESILEGNK